MSTCLECPAEWLEIEMFRMQTNFIASRWCSSIGTDVSFSRVLKAVLNLRLAKYAHVEEVDCRPLWAAVACLCSPSKEIDAYGLDVDVDIAGRR